MPTQTFVSVINCCHQIIPGIGIGTRYRYRRKSKVSVSEVSVNCGIGLTLLMTVKFSYSTTIREVYEQQNNSTVIFQAEFTVKQGNQPVSASNARNQLRHLIQYVHSTDLDR